MLSKVNRRALEGFLVLCFIAVLARIGVRSFQAPKHQRLAPEPEKLSIEGIHLDSTIQQITERFGKPKMSEYDKQEFEWYIPTVDGTYRRLVVRTNLQDEIRSVWGEVLEFEGKRILKKGQLEDEWTSRFGVVDTKQIIAPGCGLSIPRYNHPYYYPDYKLNICGATRGRFWTGSVRASSFVLSAERQEFFLGFIR